MVRPLIRVKFLAKTPPDQDPALWTSLIPSRGFEGVNFTFGLDARDYDWLVVYEGLPPLPGEKKINRIEPLACPRANTLLITTEPSSIRIDGPHFMRQFGHVLTSKSPVLTRHPHHIKATPPLRWFYGRPMGGPGQYKTVDEMVANGMPTKTKDLSTVCSTKRMAHTIHAARLDFVMALRERMPEMDVYGRGINPIDEKSEAMDDYRYHIAIENHFESGHWTEKLSDCFLAGCLPFYFGDPDYAKAFPEDAVIPIDILDLGGAEAIIRKAIAENAYEARLPALTEARRRVLESHNVLGWVADFVTKQPPSLNSSDESAAIYGRHAFRRHHPVKALSDMLFRTRMHRHPLASPLQNKAARKNHAKL